MRTLEKRIKVAKSANTRIPCRSSERAWSRTNYPRESKGCRILRDKMSEKEP